MTPAQAVTKVRYLIPDNTATSFITDDEIRAHLWHGECELNQVIGCNQVQTYFSSVTATQEYSAPTGITEVHRVAFESSQLKRIDLRDLNALDALGYGGTFTSGDPEYWYFYGGKIGVWPVPAASASTINIWGIREPTEISSSSTQFSIPDSFHRYLPDYACYMLSVKDQMDGMVNHFSQKWENDKREAQALWARREYYNSPQVVKSEEYWPTTDVGIV